MNEVTIYQIGMGDLERMARAFAQSKLFGVQNDEQALALCLVAQAEGRHPASAANDYHIINGRPSKKAEAMLRDFIAGGGKVEWHTLDDTTADATFSHPNGGTVRIAWDFKRKAQAQINNPMWTKYPRQMLRSRCISEGVRTVFPAATSGMYEPEETKEFASSPPPLRDVTPRPPEPAGGQTRGKSAGKAQRALEAARAADSDQRPDDTGEHENAATRNPEPTAPHSNGDDRPDMDGAVADFADVLEFEIDGATHYATLAKHINETTKGPSWAALKAADPERARLLKDKATARVSELREASERTVAA